MELDCFECGACISGSALTELGDAFLHHARAEHEWPFPDQGIRNYAEATQRLTGPSDRLDRIGRAVIHPVATDRLGDWMTFFDHDAFVGTPEWAACYCLEPHVRAPGGDDSDDVPHWQENRTAMVERLRHGTAYGYLAYVDDTPAGWVNASFRSTYTLHPPASDDDPPGTDTIGISCFIIAPPYRRHGLAGALLDRVISDAGDRGASWIEAYPFNELQSGDAGNFRGPRALFDARGFAPVVTLERHTVMRRRVVA